MSGLSASLLLILAVFTATLPRRWAAVAIAAGALFLTQGHTLQVFGYAFHVPRILAYIAFARVLIRKELLIHSLNRLDIAFLLVYAYTTTILVFRPDEPIPLRFAKMADMMTGYLAFRALLQSPDELKDFLIRFSLLLIPFVALLMVERLTGRNPFAIIGGNTTAWLREGVARCFGSFRHPSLMGSVGASFFPLFVALGLAQNTRKWGAIGAALCLGVVYLSNSGGPLSALAMGVVAWAIWPLRKKMKHLRWAMVLGISLLALIMKAPIWYIFARVSSITGGTGWHRSYLIEVSMRHFDRWWLVGLPISETRGWFPYNLASTGGADMTNQFIALGLQGGIAAIVLFLVFLTQAYKFLGRALASLRSDTQRYSVENEYLLWGLGATVTVHISNFLGITYWDQFWLLWLLHMAAVSAITSYILGQSSEIEQWPSPQQGPWVENQGPHEA